LESLIELQVNLTGKITAAAVTGPAKHPRPASSVPHSKSKFENFSFSISIDLNPKFNFALLRKKTK
jgi:hypothetical protein